MSKEKSMMTAQEIAEKCKNTPFCSKCSFYIPIIGGKGCYFSNVQPYLWDHEYIMKELEAK